MKANKIFFEQLRAEINHRQDVVASPSIDSATTNSDDLKLQKEIERLKKENKILSAKNEQLADELTILKVELEKEKTKGISDFIASDAHFKRLEVFKSFYQQKDQIAEALSLDNIVQFAIKEPSDSNASAIEKMLLDILWGMGDVKDKIASIGAERRKAHAININAQTYNDIHDNINPTIKS